MPTCANCKQPYDAGWDACPNCAPKLRRAVLSTRAWVAFIGWIVLIGLIVSAVSALAKA